MRYGGNLELLPDGSYGIPTSGRTVHLRPPQLANALSSPLLLPSPESVKVYDASAWTGRGGAYHGYSFMDGVRGVQRGVGDAMNAAGEGIGWTAREAMRRGEPVVHAGGQYLREGIQAGGSFLKAAPGGLTKLAFGAVGAIGVGAVGAAAGAVALGATVGRGTGV